MRAVNAPGMFKSELDICFNVPDSAGCKTTVFRMQSFKNTPIESGVRRKIGEVPVHQLAEAAECRTQVAAPLR